MHRWQTFLQRSTNRRFSTLPSSLNSVSVCVCHELSEASSCRVLRESSVYDELHRICFMSRTLSRYVCVTNSVRHLHVAYSVSHLYMTNSLESALCHELHRISFMSKTPQNQHYVTNSMILLYVTNFMILVHVTNSMSPL